METSKHWLWDDYLSRLDEMQNKVFNELWQILNFNWGQYDELFDIFVMSAKLDELDRISFATSFFEKEYEWWDDFDSNKALETECLERFFENIVAKIYRYYDKTDINWINNLIRNSIKFYTSNWITDYSQKMELLEIIINNMIQSKMYDKIRKYIEMQTENESIDEVIMIAHLLVLLMKHLNKHNNVVFRILDNQFAIALINSRAVEKTVNSIINKYWEEQQVAIKKWKEFNEIVGRPELVKQREDRFNQYA